MIEGEQISEYDTEQIQNLPNLKNIISKTQEQILRMKSLEKDDDYNVNITVSELAEIAYKCNSEPLHAVDLLRKLGFYTDRIINDKELQNTMFNIDINYDQQDLENDIDSFFQDIYLLYCNKNQYYQYIMPILAQLAIIDQNEFGYQCFKTMNLIAKSSSKKETKELMQKYCIPKINVKNLNDIPLFIIEGVMETIEITEDPSITDQIKVQNISKWIDQLIKIYSQNLNDQDIEEDQLKLHTYSIKFISKVCQNEKNVQFFQEKNLFHKIMALFYHMMNQQTSKNINYQLNYVYILEIFINACTLDIEEEDYDEEDEMEQDNISKAVAESIIKTQSEEINFMKLIMDEIKVFFDIFKSNSNQLKEENKKEAKIILKLKSQKFANLISLYGCVNLYNKDINEEELKDNQIINDIFEIINLDFCEPILLTAACKFANFMIENDAVEKNLNNLHYVTTKLKMLQPLLTYLGDKKYEKICTQVLEQNHKIPLKDMQIEIVHDLFVEIVKLIKYFSQKALIKDHECRAEMEKVSELLNEQEREKYLFNCLSIPSDNVRLEIVECLMTVNVDQWESDEIAKLLQICTIYKNLGAGQTEKVLSNIFMIVARFCMESKDNVIKEFINVYAGNAVKECVNILQKNMERNLINNQEENLEKIELACSCVNFLQSFQYKQDLREQNLCSPHLGQIIKKCFVLEEKYLQDYDVPIQIELTWTGRIIDYLIPVIWGKDSIMPFRLQSFRILNRIANNLEEKDEDPAENLEDFDSKYDFELIKNKILVNLHENKIYKELQIWEIQKTRNKFVDSQKTDWQQKNQQYNYIINNQALQKMIYFVLGTKSIYEEPRHFEGMFHKYQQLNLKEDIEEWMQNFNPQKNSVIRDSQKSINEEKEQEIIKKERKKFFSKNYKSQFQQEYIKLGQRKYQVNEDVLQNIIMEPIQFSHNSGKNQYQNDDGEQNLKQKYQSPPEFSKKDMIGQDKPIEIKPDAIEPSRRSLIIATLLRCLYSAIIYAPCAESENFEHGGQTDQRKKCIDLLFSMQNIQHLTLLCAWAGWDLGNIASKYLQLINVILEETPQPDDETQTLHQLHNYEIISIACHDIIKLIEKKLQEKDKKPLNTDDNILIREITKCINIICTNGLTVNWSQLLFLNPKLPKSEQDKQHDDLQQDCGERLINFFLSIKDFPIYVQILTFNMKIQSKLGEEPIIDETEREIREDILQNLTSLFGTYISGNVQERIKIIRSIIKPEYFSEGEDKIDIRRSFLQSILEISAQRTFQIELNIYMKSKGTFFDKNMDTTLDQTAHVHYRINDKYYDCLLAITNDTLFLFDYNLQILQDSVLIEGNVFDEIKNEPVLRHKIKISDILEIQKLETNNRIALILNDKEEQEKGGFFSNIFGNNKKQHQKNDDQQSDCNHKVIVIQFLRLGECVSFKKVFSDNQLYIRQNQFIIKSLQSLVPNKKGKKIQKQILCQLWCVFRPKNPYDRFTHENLQTKHLVLIFEDELLVLKENTDSKIYQSNNEQKFVQAILDRQKQRKNTIKDDNSITQAFYKVDSISLQNIKQVIYAKNLIPLVTITFQSQEDVTILFKDDKCREDFRMSMLIVLKKHKILKYWVSQEHLE